MYPILHKVWNWFSIENLDPTYGRLVDPGEMVPDQPVDVERERKNRASVIIESDIKKKTVFPMITEQYEKKISTQSKKLSDDIVIIQDPYGYAPLTALLLWKTEYPVEIHISVMGKGEKGTFHWSISGQHIEHRVPVLGLYPDWNNQVIVEEFDSSGKCIRKREVQITTSALPDSLCDAVQVIKHQEKSACPLILVSGKSVPLPFAFDEQGDIRYYLNYRPKGYGILPLSNGHFIIVEKNVLVPTYQLPHSTEIYEMDYWGRVFKTYYVPKGCHHDVIEKTPNGNLLLISNSIEGHVGDVIIELDRETGEVIKKINMKEIFGDTHRDRINWTHLNAITYLEKEDALIVSARNLHSIIKINYSTSELIWILGDPHFWRGTPFRKMVLRPVGEVKWFYQQHAPLVFRPGELTKDDRWNIVVFDNHWHKRRKVSNFDHDPKSYVKIYSIHENRKSVKMIHSYATAKSKITSNPVVDIDKRRVFSMGAYLEPTMEGRGGLIEEFDMDTEVRLNRYSIKNFYYRAIRPEFCLEEMSKPYDVPNEPCVGFLRKPEKLSTIVQRQPSRCLKEVAFLKREKVTFSCVGDVLRISTKDHLLEKVWLSSQNHQYLMDLTRPKQTDLKFSEIVYAVGIPLHNLMDDRYQIWIQFKQKIYDSEHYVTITHE